MKRRRKEHDEEFQNWLSEVGTVPANSDNIAPKHIMSASESALLRANIQKLKAGNQNGVEEIILFLEKDYYSHGSGYLKEKAWKYLRRADLNEIQKARLCAVAISYVQTRLCREFFPMCRCICLIADENFREQINLLENSRDLDIQRRAKLLGAYLQSLEFGERYRCKSRMSRFYYLHGLDFPNN